MAQSWLAIEAIMRCASSARLVLPFDPLPGVAQVRAKCATWRACSDAVIQSLRTTSAKDKESQCSHSAENSFARFALERRRLRVRHIKACAIVTVSLSTLGGSNNEI